MIDMKYGRKDANSPDNCADEGYLPAGNAPFPDADTPQAIPVETLVWGVFFFAEINRVCGAIVNRPGLCLEWIYCS